MKTLLLRLLLLTSLLISAQDNKGNLLLLKIEKERHLKIEKVVSEYIVLELDSNYDLVNNSEISSIAYFKDFTDNTLFSCIENDSIRLQKRQKEDTFNHYNNFGLKNFNLIEDNSKKMNYLMELNIKSPLYNQKVKISYTFINCSYCKGDITKYDSDYIGYKGKVVLIIDNLIIDNKTKISDDNLYSFIKQIDYNSHLW
jgi:hypothetical protein